MSDYDIAVTFIESLAWSGRKDIVAAGRFLIFRVTGRNKGERIAILDAYLLTGGKVEVWEALDESPDADYVAAHPDWLATIEPILRAALAGKVPDLPTVYIDGATRP